MAADTMYAATGRRKCSIAAVRMSAGKGDITVNQRTLDVYFPRPTLRMMIRQPFELTGTSGRFDVTAKVCGGGASGQAGALRHGISRALIKMDLDLRGKLKKEGFLTRDPRVKERKKFGQKGARARFQFSKR